MLTASPHAVFRGEMAAPEGDLAVVVGNCQAESLRIVLDGNGLRTVRVPPVHELTAADVPVLAGWLARARVLVTQPIRDDYRGLPVGSAQLAARLPRGAGAVRVPVVRFAGLFPAHAIIRPPHDRSAVPPVVAYHDLRVLMEAAGRRLPPLTRAAALALAELSRRELRVREEAHGTVMVSDLFASPSFAQMRTLNHPGNALWNPVAARVREALGLPAHDGDPGRPLADSIHAPREPAVLEAFDLPDAPEPDWLVEGARITAEEVREAHLRWYADHPDAVTSGLERHAEALELLSAQPPIKRGLTPFDDAPVTFVGGSPRHGVVRHARQIAAALGRGTEDLVGTGPLHVHVTDKLWGTGPEAAADALEALAERRPLTVTLHDLPQASDGPERQPRRAAAYARIARVARGVVVSSEHEAALLRAVVDVEATVIPLPVGPVAAPDPTAELDDQVTVLGFFYPGKGHAEVIAATPPGLGVTVLGAASPGHEGELAALAGKHPVTVTGWLEDAELVARLRRAAVPVAAHRHLSASGSIVAWVAAGRRPLVPDGPATRELAGLRPGTLTLYDDLPAAIAAARADPASTWLAPGTSTRPAPADAAAAYRAWWAR